VERKIILALNDLEIAQAIDLLRTLKELIVFLYAFKLQDLFLKGGRNAINRIRQFDGINSSHMLAMVDLKFYDIPRAVFSMTKAAVDEGADIVTVHIEGSMAMMKMALAANSKVQYQVWGVTSLTSISEEENLRNAGRSTQQLVSERVEQAEEAGLHGVVCSSLEAAFVSSRPKFKARGMVIATPGVRSEGANRHDQQRVDTPANALRQGAHYVIVGREVTESRSPYEALKRIVEDIRNV